MDDEAPLARKRSEQGKRDAALRYDLEREFRKVGWAEPALVYLAPALIIMCVPSKAPSPTSVVRIRSFRADDVSEFHHMPRMYRVSMSLGIRFFSMCLT